LRDPVYFIMLGGVRKAWVGAYKRAINGLGHGRGNNASDKERSDDGDLREQHGERRWIGDV
jgi:hypothetical protein